MGKWEEKRIHSVAEVFSGFAFAAEDMGDSGIPIVRIGNIQNKGVLKETNVYFPIDKLLPKHKKYYLQDIDTLVAMTGAGSVGKFGKMRNKTNEFLVNQRVGIIRPELRKIDQSFMYYVLTLPHFETYLYNIGIGAGQPNISANDIGSILINLPNLPTQKRIADILSVYDDLIENNNRRIELLEKAAQEIYKEWFVRMRFPGYEKVRFIGGIPNDWKYLGIDDIIQIIDGDRGKNYPKQDEFSEEGYCLFLNTGNVTKNGFAFSNNSFVSKEKDSLLRKGKLQREDIVMTTRGTVGNLAFYNRFIPFENIRINSGMVIIRGKNSSVNPNYLFCLLRSDSIKKLIELFSSGSAQPQLPIKDMKKIKVVIPTEYLIKQFTKQVSEIEDLLGNLNSQNRNLIKQRDLLLPRLMSGKLEV